MELAENEEASWSFGSKETKQLKILTENSTVIALIREIKSPQQHRICIKITFRGNKSSSEAETHKTKRVSAQILETKHKNNNKSSSK